MTGRLTRLCSPAPIAARARHRVRPHSGANYTTKGMVLEVSMTRGGAAGGDEESDPAAPKFRSPRVEDGRGESLAVAAGHSDGPTRATARKPPPVKFQGLARGE